MTKTEAVTAAFVITKGQKEQLQQWAAQDDRSVSYIMRQSLEKEQQRRAAQDATRKAKRH